MPRITAVDAHIGARLKRRRALRGISQAELAKLAGLTYQQVQKYEKGESRITAGALYHFGKALGVEASYFYERLPSDEPSAARRQRRKNGGAAADVADPMASRETVMLVGAYYRIRSHEVRRQVFDMVRTLSADGQSIAEKKAAGRGRRRRAAP
jgi:transcriptional regulator with XRE-family HTH domain